MLSMALCFIFVTFCVSWQHDIKLLTDREKVDDSTVHPGGIHREQAVQYVKYIHGT